MLLKINQFKKDGAIHLKGKFDISWINKLQKGIEVSHKEIEGADHFFTDRLDELRIVIDKYFDDNLSTHL